MYNIEKIVEYFFYIKSYSRDLKKNKFIVALKILYCRFFFKIGPKYFCLYKLDDKIFDVKNYIHKQDMDIIQSNVNPNDYIYLADNKIEFFKKCEKEKIPTPEILAIIDFSNQVRCWEGLTVNSKELLNQLLKSLKDGEYIFKACKGSYGMEMISIKVNNGLIFNNIDNKSLNYYSIHSHLIKYNKCFILQHKLNNSIEIEHIMGKKALGTIRVVTYVENDGNVKVPYAFAKIPIEESINDNFCHGDSGNLLCGIDPVSGNMMRAYGKGKKIVTLENLLAHPKSGILFENQIVPYWYDVVSLVRGAAKKFLPLKTLGWDVAISENGIFLLEANWHYDPDGPQVTLGRGIKKEILSLYSR